MIKVCHVTSAHPKEDVRIFQKECVSLAKAGYDVYLVEQGESYEKDGVHIVGFGDMPQSRIKRILSTSQTAYKKALGVDADIYHLHDPELLPFALKLKKRGKKVIFDSHEFYREQLGSKSYLPSWLSRLIATCYGKYENYILRRIDAVVCPCTLNGNNPFEGRCKRVSIISNAAILGEFFHLFDANAEKIPNSVCYVGGLTEARGITNNIIASHKAGATLLLAGSYESAEYEESLKRLPAFSCVSYQGLLDRKAVADLLSRSMIGLCTLLDRGQYLKIDTFGIKVYEYMSMGLPVILSNSTYNKAMVAQYNIGLCVDPDNTDELSKAISYLLYHPDEAKRMGENGRKAVKEEFNWGVQEKKLVALYQDILKD